MQDTGEHPRYHSKDILIPRSKTDDELNNGQRTDLTG